MTKWVRWWGLLAFVVLVAVIVGFWLLFIDAIVANLIESQGTRLVGAKVELQEADLSLVPAGLTLTGLQVTNPREPMRNAIEIARLALTLDGAKLFQRKIIVEEMTADEVRFDTARETSGAVASPPEPVPPTLGEGADRAGPRFQLPSFEVPDPEEILAKEDLRTLRLAEELKADLLKERDAWQERLRELSGKETFEQYRARIEKLKGAGKGRLGGVLEGVGEVQSLREDLQRDLEALKSAQSQFRSQLQSLKARVDALKQAPTEDVRRLQEKYSLTPQGLANLSENLLGRRIGEWADQAALWYARLRPVLERARQARAAEGKPEVVKPLRASGFDVRFQEREPLPDFLIRRARLSLQLDLGELAGRIENITPDQDVLDRPLTFEFSGEKLTGVRTVNLRGNLDHTQPDRAKDRVNLRVDDYQIHDFVLSRQDTWPITVRRGMADLTARAMIQEGAVDANLESRLKSLQVSTEQGDEGNPLVSALNSAITGVSTLQVSADVTGTLDDYHIALRSDLDRILKQAAGNVVRDMSARLKKALSARISEKVEGPIKDVTASFGDFRAIGGELAQRLTRGNDLLGELLRPGGAKEGPGGLPGGFKLPF